MLAEIKKTILSRADTIETAIDRSSEDIKMTVQERQGVVDDQLRKLNNKLNHIEGQVQAQSETMR